MKLLFKKDADNQISVFQEIDGTQKEFSYIEMIKKLINSKALEEPDISGDFTEAESDSIKRMVKLINKEVSPERRPEEDQNTETNISQ